MSNGNNPDTIRLLDVEETKGKPADNFAAKFRTYQDTSVGILLNFIYRRLNIINETLPQSLIALFVVMS